MRDAPKHHRGGCAVDFPTTRVFLGAQLRFHDRSCLPSLAVVGESRRADER